MSNLVPVNVQIPAHVAARIGAPSVLAQAILGGISSSAEYPRISIKGSRFRIVEGETETVLDSTTIDVVIVGANPHVSKSYYAKPWTPDSEPTAPDCFSLDGIRPHADSADPQNDLCASCPHNAWGSKVSPLGSSIKACPDQKRLAVVAADDVSGPVYLLQVTPAAIKGLNQYQKELMMRNLPAECIKTRVSFDTDASFPKLKFSFAGFLELEEQEVVNELFGSDRVKEITGELSAAAEVPAAAPARPAPVKLAKPAPVAKAPEPVVEEQAPAPKRGFGAKASSAPAAKPAAKKAVAAAPASAASESTSSLMDEITALVMEVGADDA